MLVIPTAAVPSQTVNVVLANQNCRINMYEKLGYSPASVGTGAAIATDTGALLVTEAGALIVVDEPALVNDSYPALYLDLYVNDALIIGGVLCLNANVIVRDAYLGFTGDLAFYDTQGTSDPVSTGLGGRYVLMYLEAADLVGLTVQ